MNLLIGVEKPNFCRPVKGKVRTPVMSRIKPVRRGFKDLDRNNDWGGRLNER